MSLMISESQQYLTFMLGDELFAIEITCIREVVDYTTITKVPRMPAYLRGVINLRGNVVSVIDLKLKLGMSALERTPDTCIIIAEIRMDDECLQTGLLADAVQEVLHLTPDQIEPPPKIGMRLRPDFIQGIGKRDNEFIIILNIENVLSDDEWGMVRAVNENPVQEESV